MRSLRSSLQLKFSIVCISIFLSIAKTQESFSRCYFRNGQEQPDRMYPCRQNRHSMCYDRRYDQNDRCESNGLIWNSYDATGKTGNGSYWRTACTDRTWKSEYCIDRCSEVTESSVRITKCSDGTWCCQADCCKLAGRFELKDLDELASEKSSSSAAASTNIASSLSTVLKSSSLPATSTNITPLPSNTSQDADKQPTQTPSNSPSLAIPLGVGLGVGLPAMGLIIGVILWFLLRKQPRAEPAAAEYTGKAELHGNPAYFHSVQQHLDYHQQAPSELYGREVAVEMGHEIRN